MVSVVIPVYNMEKYLDKCILSVLSQTYNDYEIILVNDGSIDDSERIIDRYAVEYPTIVRKINKENGGLSSARNAALQIVKGKYVTFLDSDDYYDRNYLKILVEKAEKEGLDVVCSGQNKVTEDGIVLKTIRYKLRNGKCLQRRLNISGKLYKADYIRKWKLRFPEGKIYEDNSFNLQAFFLSTNIGFLEYEGYFQVVHEGSITSKVIDPAKLPFDEWSRVAEKVHSERVHGVDLEHFDFIFLSFITYFLMVRNRGREYLPNENRNRSMENITGIAVILESIINDSFPHYGRNKYCNPLRLNDLLLTQKIGTWVVFYFAKYKKLDKLVKLVYSLPIG